jgi:hypothetical protein
VLRTPFGERDEDKERVNVVAILSNLQSLSGTLDGLKAKLAGKPMAVSWRVGDVPKYEAALEC